MAIFTSTHANTVVRATDHQVAAHRATDHQVAAHRATDHQAGIYVQTRKDTMEPISGLPDYMPPEDWPGHHIAMLNASKGK